MYRVVRSAGGISSGICLALKDGDCVTAKEVFRFIFIRNDRPGLVDFFLPIRFEEKDGL